MTAGSLRFDPADDVNGAILQLRSGDTTPPGPLLVFAGPDSGQRESGGVGGVVNVRRLPAGANRVAKTYVRLQTTDRDEGRVRVFGDLPLGVGRHDWTGELAHESGSAAFGARRSGHVVLRCFDANGDMRRTARLGGRESLDGGAPNDQVGEAVSGRRGDLKLYDSGEQRAHLWIDDDSGGRLTLRGERGTAALGVDQGGAFLSLVTTDGGEIRIDPSGIAIANVLKDRFLNSFIARHPDEPEVEIRYTVLEGPEPGTYVRGSATLVSGRAHVALPEHFRHVTSPRGLTVQLTPRSRLSKGVCASQLNLSELLIEELLDGDGSYDVDYQVHGVRRGFEDYEVLCSVPKSVRTGASEGT